MRITALSGGVGGARLLRGLAAVGDIELTAIVNVGDDDRIYGLHLSPDLDTVTYTLAGVHSESRGWGRTGETWNVMEELARFGVDTSFRVGDRDLALNLYRTARLADGAALSTVTAEITAAFDIPHPLLPVTDDPVRTRVRVEGEWIDFQDYFVRRRHAVPVDDVAFDGASEARTAPGVLEALANADAVVIGPSNPILSIWPILAVPGVRDALAPARVVAVSPLISGAAVKGPLADLMPRFGFSLDTAGVLAAYGGLVGDVIVHSGDERSAPDGTRVLATDTRIAEPAAAARLAKELIAWLV